MADTTDNNDYDERDEGEGAENQKLYTLSQISELTGVSMPTLQRYKKTYQERIPSVGEGRRQRYPESALPVFNELKVENAGRRGRPRKDASAPVAAPVAARRGRKPTAAKKAPATRGRGAKPARAVAKSAAKPVGRPARGGRPAAGGRRAQAAPAAKQAGSRSGRTNGLMTLTQISKDTGISYPTLVRYVRLHANRLPHEGTGRGRRFYPKAVEVFRSLRQESGRGGRRASSAPAGARRGGGDDAGLSRQVKALEKSHLALEKKIDGLLRTLKKAFG
jgi:predicted site-specific integrase-resolvase